MKRNNFEIYTSFHLSNTEVAIDVRAVQEVVNFPDKIIPMPLSPDFLVGIFNLRGMVIPVVNLKTLLKYADDAVTCTQKVAIVEIEGARIGLIFDSTSEILRVNESTVCDFNYVSENSHKVISGAIKLDDGSRILQILDSKSLLTIENVPQIIEQQQRLLQQKIEKRSDQRQKCISFTVDRVRMAIEISKIHEIVKIPELKKSSIQNDIFLGNINLRGRTVPVVSFSKILKIKRDEMLLQDSDQRIMILKIGQELIGLVVDTVECISHYFESDVMTVPLLNKERSAMFRGCVNLLNEGETFLISFEHILTNHEILEVTEGHSKMYQNTTIENDKKNGRKESYISFKLDHLFGISIKDIKEIINYSDDVLQAPGMPSFVKGMLKLRSQLVTIIDTRLLYKMPSAEIDTSSAKILVFEKDDERFGLVVDELESILSIDQDKKFKVPSLLTQKIQSQFQDDIKEIVTIAQGEKEGALIILNVASVSERIKSTKAA